MAERSEILCFTDILCGHCYFADARFEQLKADFGDQVHLTYHFHATFGDVRRKIDHSGKSDSEYGAMVRDVADRFDHVTVHPDIFRKNIPSSSIPSHLYLRAVKLLEDEGAIERGDDAQSPFERMMWELRLAFFRDLVDVSQRKVLDEIADRLGIPTGEVARAIDDGRAFADLNHDAKLTRSFNVQMTPALVLNEGRQVLNGNVGYRVIEANIRELLSNHPAELSWY
jgi:predicted DsbA family dithiol-disulfide isomerase